jgi:hypothetical protein
VHPHATASVTNSTGEIRLGARGYDDDGDFGEFCPIGYGPRMNGESWKSTGDMNDCRAMLMSSSRIRHDQLDRGLVYKVRGTYKVTYVQLVEKGLASG